MKTGLHLFMATALVALVPALPVYAAPAAAPAKAAIGQWGVDISGLSKTARPGDDFYRHVNEGWLKTARMLPGIPFMDGFVEAFLAAEQRVGSIIKQSRETTAAPGSPEQMIGDFHRAHANIERRNALGITPIASTLSIISGTTDRNDIAKLMAMPWMDGLVGGGVTTDVDNPRRQIAVVGASGFTMPSRDYYLVDAEPYVGHRKALQAYMADCFRRAGIPDADGRAARVMALEMEIGRIYVAQYFGAADKAKVEEMVGYLRATYRDRIGKLDWMDASTKAEALKELEKITTHIGYPDKWHERSSVRITADDFVGNQNRLMAWKRADSLKKLAEGTRDWEFPYSPQEVNAGYSPSTNSMTYPAGILQPPFFDPKADAAVNFGSIAAVIGHEIGHGFDDQGSRSDGDGKLRDWWSAASRAEFEKRTAGLVEQFNGYEALPGLKINGRQNLGENIGDLGGLSVAYAAYQTYVREKQGGKAPVIDGYTGDQRFFLAWAQVWRNITAEGETRRRTLSDVHSPCEFRVNGIVRNMDAWYRAFNVKPGDKLYLAPERRVKIW